MNKERLKKLADFLYTNPRNFKYDNCAEKFDDEVFYCAAGFSAVVFPEFCETQFNSMQFSTLHGKREYRDFSGIDDFCQKFYGLDYYDVQELFFGGHSIYRECGHFEDITPKIAADVIMKFISEKEKEIAL